MRLSLTKYTNTVPTIIIDPLTQFPLYLPWLVLRVVSTVNLCTCYFCKIIGKLTAFLQSQDFSSPNQAFTIVARRSPHSETTDWLRVRVVTGGYGQDPFTQVKSKVGNILAKISGLRINLNIDGVPIVSRSHTHPSHSHTSLLLTSSLS